MLPQDPIMYAISPQGLDSLATDEPERPLVAHPPVARNLHSTVDLELNVLILPGMHDT